MKRLNRALTVEVPRVLRKRAQQVAIDLVLIPYHGQPMLDLAEVYRSQGKFTLAEPLYRRALLIDEELLGPDHLDVGTDLNNLGALYFSEGRPADAAPLLKRGLAIKEAALGANSPQLLQIIDNYTVVLHALGRASEAAPLESRAKALRAWTVTP